MVTWHNCRGPHSPSYEREAGSLGSSNASHRMRGSHTWAKCIRGAQRILATDGQFKIIILRQHYEPLKRAARLLHIPCEYSFEGYRDAVDQLIGALASPDRDMWVSSTLFVTEGHFGEDTVVDLVPTAYHQDKGAPRSIQVGVSTWQRSSDTAVPARIKTGSNYQVSLLARIEGKSMGYDDMVLLNQSGRVVEATASFLLMVRDDAIASPPATEGVLESITLDIVESLAQSLGIKFIRRPIRQN